MRAKDPRPAGERPELRVALVGYGLSGAVFHAPLVSATAGMRLTTVVTSDPTRRREALARYPGIDVTGEINEVFDPTAHDLVVVASPTGSHARLGLRALEAGVPVVIDKPVATTGGEARELSGVAGRMGGWASVFHNRRWDGETLTARALLADGRLGDLVRLESRFERWRPQANPTAWREQTPAPDGGGLLLDLGSHLVDQALFLLGPARTVYAEVARRRPGVAAEDDVFISLEHLSGVHSHLWTSAVAAQPGPSLRLLGSGAAYVKRELDIQEDALRSGEVPGGPGWGREAPELWGDIAAGELSEPLETVAGDWPRYYAEVVESLTLGSPPPVTLAEAVAVVEVLDAARESARLHRVVSLP